jgi:hypothetical protein
MTILGLGQLQREGTKFVTQQLITKKNTFRMPRSHQEKMEQIVAPKEAQRPQIAKLSKSKSPTNKRLPPQHKYPWALGAVPEKSPRIRTVSL